MNLKKKKTRKNSYIVVQKSLVYEASVSVGSKCANNFRVSRELCMRCGPVCLHVLRTYLFTDPHSYTLTCLMTKWVEQYRALPPPPKKNIEQKINNHEREASSLCFIKICFPRAIFACRLTTEKERYSEKIQTVVQKLLKWYQTTAFLFVFRFYYILIFYFSTILLF